MLPGVTAFPCHHLCAEWWRMSGSSFRFQHFHHLVGCGVGCALLEEAGNGKDGVAHADFRHTVRAAVCFDSACLFGFCHRLSFRCFVSCFNRFSFSCAQPQPGQTTALSIISFPHFEQYFIPNHLLIFFVDNQRYYFSYFILLVNSK